MFCATVSDGIRLNAWKTNPIRLRRRIVRRRSLSFDNSVSPSATAPVVGRSSPAATWRNVLLPEPDGPMIAVNDPGSSSTLTPSRATTAPSPLPCTFRTSRSATAGAATLDSIVIDCMRRASIRGARVPVRLSGVCVVRLTEPLARVQEGENGEYPAVVVVRRREAQLREDVRHVLLDRAVGYDQ